MSKCVFINNVPITFFKNIAKNFYIKKYMYTNVIIQNVNLNTMCRSKVSQY